MEGASSHLTEKEREVVRILAKLRKLVPISPVLNDKCPWQWGSKKRQYGQTLKPLHPAPNRDEGGEKPNKSQDRVAAVKEQSDGPALQSLKLTTKQPLQAAGEGDGPAPPPFSNEVLAVVDRRAAMGNAQQETACSTVDVLMGAPAVVTGGRWMLPDLNLSPEEERTTEARGNIEQETAAPVMVPDPKVSAEEKTRRLEMWVALSMEQQQRACNKRAISGQARERRREILRVKRPSYHGSFKRPKLK